MTFPVSRPSVRRCCPGLARLLFGLGCALLPVAAAQHSALGAPALPAAATTGDSVVPFPAAANIQPGPVQIGPIEYAAGITLTSNDVVTLDYLYNGVAGSTNSGTYGAVLDFSVHGGGTGSETVLASSSVGSGVSYGAGYGDSTVTAVSPAGMIYYFINTSPGSGFQELVMLNPSTLVRTVGSDGTNGALGPQIRSIGGYCWDLSTNTILYIDYGANGNVPALYRVDPATGLRVAVTTSGVAFNNPDYLTTDAFGNLFYVDAPAGTAGGDEIVEIPAGTPGAGTFAARKVISGTGIGSGAAYIDIGGVAVDPSQVQTISSGLPTAQSLVVDDAGNDQASSAIYRVSSANGNRTVILNNANNKGPAVFDFPSDTAVDTTGKIYYKEQHNAGNGAANNVNTLNYLTLSGPNDTILSNAQNLSDDFGLDVLVLVPPPQPTLATGTTSNVLGSTATLNSTVTGDGGVTNSGIIARGFVYALTGTNSSPKIAGTGVTQVSNFVAGSLPVAQGANGGAFTNNLAGLSMGTSYTFAAYAQDVSGFGYGVPITFVTATVPTVTTTTPATNLTGVSATLGGNVTSAGGGNATLTTRGIVYAANSVNATPTIGATGVTNITDPSNNTGTYTDNTGNNLANGTTYAYRAYATNQIGTTYGSVSTFTTIAPPTANNQSVNVPFNTATAVTLSGSDPNTPTQTLTYSVATSPGHGTLSGTAPNLTYTPTNGYHGTDSFTFTTSNTSGLTSAAATVTLTVAPGTPTANPQSVSVPFNTATAITLSGTDPDVPALTLTYTVVTSPSHGTLSGTSPNLTYTPTAGYQGTDSFTFRVSNGTNSSNNATVSITVSAGTPTANSQSVSVPHATAKAITLTGTDPDSPALTLTYTVATSPSHGTLSGTAPNLTYTPTSTYQGADSFTFTVSNTQKTSAAATVAITVAAGVPTATAQAVNVNLNLPAAVTLAGTDPDSPALALTYTIVTSPTNGTLSGTAPNLTYTPNTNYTGSDSFTFTVSNGQNTSAAATVSLTVIGEPTISSFIPATGPVGTTVTINGTNLQNATGLNFLRNVPGTSFTIVSSTQVTVKVPSGAASGILTVISGSGSNNSSTKFTVTP